MHELQHSLAFELELQCCRYQTSFLFSFSATFPGGLEFHKFFSPNLGQTNDSLVKLLLSWSNSLSAVSAAPTFVVLSKHDRVSIHFNFN